jgi:acyl dehydratase
MARAEHADKLAPLAPVQRITAKIMAIAEEIVGTHYRSPDYFAVGREKIREFAAAVKNDHPAHYDENAAAEYGYDRLIAPLTFLAVAGRRVQLELFKQFAVPINMARVLHRDQKLIFHRPILAGDKLFFDSYLDSVIESHGTVIAELRGEVSDADGKPIVTSIMTVIGEAAAKEEADEVVSAIANRIPEAATTPPPAR